MKRYARLAVVLAIFTSALALVGVEPAGAVLHEKPARTWRTNGRVMAVLPIGDRIYVGGSFTSVIDTAGISTPARNLAVFSATTGAADLGFQGGTNGLVTTLSTDGTDLFVGGDFSNGYDASGGSPRGRLASFDLSSGALRPWAPVAIGGQVEVVRHIATTDSIYIGGNFTSLSAPNGTGPNPYLAKVDRVLGAVDMAFVATPNDRVRAIAAADDGTGRLVVGGDFTSVSGQVKTRSLTALDQSTGAIDAGFVPGPNNLTNIAPVYDLVSDGTRLYQAVAGGGGACAASDVGNGSTLWSHHTNGNAQSVRRIGATVYCGGHFAGTNAIGSYTRFKIAAIDGATGAMQPFAPRVSSALGVWGLGTQAGDPNLYVAGDFPKINGVDQPFFAMLIDSTRQAPPQRPSSLIAHGGDGLVRLGWTPPSGDGGAPIKSYRLYRAASPGSFDLSGPPLATLGPDVTHFDDLTVQNGTTNHYVVVATNKKGASPPSPEASATPASGATPSAPSPPRSVTATTPPGSIHLTWNPPADDGGAPIVSYTIFRGTSPGGQGSTPYAEGVTGTSFDDLYNIIAGTTYYYTVAAVSAGGQSPVSAEAFGTVQPGKPGAPVISGSAVSNGISLSWTRPPDGGTPITKYVVLRDAQRIAGNVSPDATTYVDKTAVSGQTYVYQVRAANAQGNGPLSNKVTVSRP